MARLGRSFPAKPTTIHRERAGQPLSVAYQPSGGLQIAGAAALVKEKVFAVSGGIQTAGSGAPSKTKTFAVSGGIQIAGASPSIFVRVFAPSGGIQIAGTATLEKLKIYTPSGGVQIAGQASTSSSSGAVIWLYAGSGGLDISGAADTAFVRIYPYQPSGGVEIAGGALVAKIRVYLPSGGVLIGGETLLEKLRIYEVSGGITTGGEAATSYTEGGQYEWFPTDSGITIAGAAETSGPHISGRREAGAPSGRDRKRPRKRYEIDGRLVMLNERELDQLLHQMIVQPPRKIAQAVKKMVAAKAKAKPAAQAETFDDTPLESPQAVWPASPVLDYLRSQPWVRAQADVAAALWAAAQRAEEEDDERAVQFMIDELFRL